MKEMYCNYAGRISTWEIKDMSEAQLKRHISKEFAWKRKMFPALKNLKVSFEIDYDGGADLVVRGERRKRCKYE